jgi:hypothetical protein
MILTKRKQFKALLCAVAFALSSSMQTTKTIDVPSAATVSLAAIGASYFMYQARKSEKMTPRYKEQLKTLRSTPMSPKKFIEESAKCCWYLFYDGFIGQKSKSKSVSVNKDTGALETCTKKIDGFGFMNYVNDQIKPFKTTLETLGIFYLGYNFLMIPDAIRKNVEEKSKKV